MEIVGCVSLNSMQRVFGPGTRVLEVALRSGVVFSAGLNWHGFPIE